MMHLISRIVSTEITFSQSESQSSVPSADPTEIAVRAGSVTPRGKSMPRKPLVRGTVTSTLSRNTRYATRLRSETRALNAAADPQDHGDAPASPITAIRVPGPSSAEECPGQQQSGLSLPLNNNQSGKQAFLGYPVLWSESFLLGQGIPAIATSTTQTSQTKDIPSHQVQIPSAGIFSSSSTGMCLA